MFGLIVFFPFAIEFYHLVHITIKMSISLSDWIPCADITTSDTHINYVQLLKCPQYAGLFWKLEDDNGVCSHTQAGWVDWEQSDDAQKSLEFYLDTDTRNGWISPASSTPQMSNCGIRSFTAFKDTTSVLAYNSVGSITIYYHGSKQ